MPMHHALCVLAPHSVHYDPIHHAIGWGLYDSCTVERHGAHAEWHGARTMEHGALGRMHDGAWGMLQRAWCMCRVAQCNGKNPWFIRHVELEHGACEHDAQDILTPLHCLRSEMLSLIFPLLQCL